MPLSNIANSDTFYAATVIRMNQIITLLNQISEGNGTYSGTITISNPSLFQGGISLNIANGMISGDAGLISNVKGTSIRTGSIPNAGLQNTTITLKTDYPNQMSFVNPAGPLGNTININITPVTSTDDTTSTNIASAQLANTIHELARVAYTAANTSPGSAAFDKANTACTNADTAQTTGVAAFDAANNANDNATSANNNVLSANAMAIRANTNALFANDMAIRANTNALSANDMAIRANTNALSANTTALAANVIAAAANNIALGAFLRANTVNTNTILTGNTNVTSNIVFQSFNWEQTQANTVTSGTIELRLKEATSFNITLTGTGTLSFNTDGLLVSSGMGQTIIFDVLVYTNGGTTINWPSTVVWSSGTAPTLSDTKCHLFTFRNDSRQAGFGWIGSYAVNITVPTP